MKTETFAAELHRAEFQRDAINAAPAFQVALHTRRPEGDGQDEAEISLAGYARASAPRDAQTWTVEGRVARNAVLIRFPTIVSTRKQTARWLSLGLGGRIRRLAELKEPIPMGLNRRVEIEPGMLEFEETTNP
jgi:hypothetical protein